MRSLDLPLFLSIGGIFLSPKVSVIVPIYNAEPFLHQTLTSLVSQTYDNIEVLMVEDCSTDSSRKIAERFVSNKCILISNDKNMGVAKSRNRGLEQASGDLISFCDADDYWTHSKIEKQISFLSRYAADMVHSSVVLIDSAGRTVGYRACQKIVNERHLRYANPLFLSTVLVKRSILRDAKFPDAKHEDFLFWREVFRSRPVFSLGVDCGLCFYRKHSGSLSANKFRSIYWHLQILVKSNSTRPMHFLWVLFRYFHYQLFVK